MSSVENRTHTALHVLKGAVQNVLGAELTTSTYVKGPRGRLNVRFARKPTAEEIRRIEEAANKKVNEGVEVTEFEMEREEAEGHFGGRIYDIFPVPAAVTLLKLVRIPEWNVNCCAEKHLENTASVGRITLEKLRLRSSKGELEVEFHLEPV